MVDAISNKDIVSLILAYSHQIEHYCADSIKVHGNKLEICEFNSHCPLHKIYAGIA